MEDGVLIKDPWSDGTAKGFNSRFFNAVDPRGEAIHWYGKKGVVQLGKTVAEIELGIGLEVSGYMVSVRSKTKGEIVRHLFDFKDYVKGGHEVIFNSVGNIVWSHEDVSKAHFAPPEGQVAEMALEIMRYIEEYRP